MATRSTRQKAGHVTTSIVVPSGAPSWVTAELLQRTLEVWQPYYEQELIPEDALAIIMGAGYPKNLTMLQVTVDARNEDNRVKQFKVVTTILGQSIDGKQIGDLFERRWEGEVDIRSIKSTMQMDVLRCKTPDMVRKEIWTHLLAYNLLRTVIAVATKENNTEPRKVSFKGAKQALTAFAPKIEAARPEDRVRLIDALLTTIAYHRIGDRPGRWEPRARK